MRLVPINETHSLLVGIFEGPSGMRMTLPKREEDLQKVVQEVMELHPELAHEHGHEHHHTHDVDELVHTIDVLMDTVNTRLSELEDKVTRLAQETATLYRLVGVLAEALAAEGDERRRKLEEAVRLLRESLSSP